MQLQLDVPRYALEALQRIGLVYMRTYAIGTMAGRAGVQMWYDASYRAPKLRDCATMTFEGMA